MIDTRLFVLSHLHGSNRGRGCVWDLAIYQASNGRLWRDNLPCFNEVLVFAGQSINDQMNQVERLRSFSPRLQRCLRATDPGVEKRINERLILWLRERTRHEESFQRWLASQDGPGLSAVALEVSRRVLWIILDDLLNDDDRVAFLDDLIVQWEKAVAEEGAAFDLMSAEEFVDEFLQTGGS